ncbi:lipopolysaccharide-induced tumor necrosis factor-alpha factor-like isoform X2 [Tubulanus polymorphus]|uniref:lipopolysaccharide-induced tumor necrosis factor-alpha factor-like isoform X2 n=1 Tax=Tubulanus polymorphus TaxID=672921 RepID=UPI003DA48273
MSQPLLPNGQPSPVEPPPPAPPQPPADSSPVPPPPPTVGGEGPPYPDEPPPVYQAQDTEKTGFGPPPSYSYQGSVPAGQPVVIHHVPFGPHPTTIKCPNCLATVTTTVTYTPGALTWILSGLLCLFGCWPCVCIPCCVDSALDVEHTCPKCGNCLAVVRRI